MFFLLYRHTNDGVIDDFRRFPTTFRTFLKILQNLSDGRTNVAETFPKISKDYRRLSKFTEDFRGRPVPVLKRRECHNEVNWSSFNTTQTKDGRP